MITIEQALIADIKVELHPLLEAHYAEIAKYKELELQPAYDLYEILQEKGLLQVCVVRDNGILIGYCADQIVPSLHYSPHKFAINDVIFISKEYRNGLIAIKLLKYVIELLRSKGITTHTMHMKVDHRFDRLLTRLGYDEAEVIYTKLLGGS